MIGKALQIAIKYYELLQIGGEKEFRLFAVPQLGRAIHYTCNKSVGGDKI